MKEVLDVDVDLIPGSGGIFEVKVNDALVYSKADTGSFPQNDVLVKELAEKYLHS